MATFDSEIDLNALRTRTSEKWAKYPSDVLPLFVAETDFPLAPEISAVLHAAIERGDVGYAEPRGLGDAFARFSSDRYGHEVRAQDVVAVPEVMVGVAEVLRVIAKPGDRIVINPPVYPPFFSTIDEVALAVEEAPLTRDGDAYELDFDALERAFAGGARLYLFCNPHNPVGRVYSRSDVRRVAELAKKYDVAVLADEIHAPLVLPGARHTPFESVVGETGAHVISFTSASKGWNIAGLKCALAYSSSSWGQSVLKRLPIATSERVGHLGVMATVSALHDAGAYLDRVISHLDEQRVALRNILDRHGLEKIRYATPQAGFLAWLDCRELLLPEDPAKVFLKRGKVALYSGLAFGSQGAGFVRFNFGTSTEIITEAVVRMKRALENVS